MEDWDPQKMLDLYIHDYMVRNNMHTTAEIFAREANISPKNVAIAPPEGFLTEWWSLFWDLYSSKLSNDATNATEDPLSKIAQQANLPFPYVFYLLQKNSPSIPRPALPNVCPSRPYTGNFVPRVMTPGSEMNLNRSGIVTRPDINVGQAPNVTDLAAPRMHAHEHPRLPARNLSSNSLLLPFVLPSSSNSRQPPEKVSNIRQLSVARDEGCSRSVAAEPTPNAPEAMQLNAELADTGSSASSNSTGS